MSKENQTKAELMKVYDIADAALKAAWDALNDVREAVWDAREAALNAYMKGNDDG